MNVRIERNGLGQFRLTVEERRHWLIDPQYNVVSYHDTYQQAQEARVAYIAANDWQPVKDIDAWESKGNSKS